MNGTADKYLKWYTPLRGLVALLVGMGIWVGSMEIRVSHAEEDAAKVQQVAEDVAEIKGQVKILVDLATKRATSGNSTTPNQ